MVSAGEQPRGPAGRRAPVGQPGPTWTGDGSLRPRPQRPEPLNLTPHKVATGPAGLEIATFRRRLGGFLIDQGILSLIAIGMAMVIFAGVDLKDPVQSDAALQRLALAYYAVMTVYYWYFNMRGQTPGKRAMGLRLVAADGSPPGIWRSLLRAAAIQISSFFWLGYIWASWDPHTQTWHDKWARTWVVRAPESGRPPA